MTYHPKCMEIKEEFYVVYPPTELAEAQQAEKNGWNVLIESVDEQSKNVRLEEIGQFRHRTTQ